MRLKVTYYNVGHCEVNDDPIIEIIRSVDRGINGGRGGI